MTTPKETTPPQSTSPSGITLAPGLVVALAALTLVCAFVGGMGTAELLREDSGRDHRSTPGHSDRLPTPPDASTMPTPPTESVLPGTGGRSSTMRGNTRPHPGAPPSGAATTAPAPATGK